MQVTAFEALITNIDTLIDEKSLEDRLATGKRLRVKLGVDPTRPDLTFGHAVVFNKLRQFQDYGHQAILLIGDYTALIGDPSGRSSLRPLLTKEQVEENASTYLDQAFKILDPKKTEVRRNSEWFSGMRFEDALHLARKMTVARMLERDDFAKRYAQNTPISLVEFLYPLVQGYDSVKLEADIELGGTDQLFNLLVGRALQREYGQPEQIVMCMPLLVGLDGVRKMSKSFDNYIAFNDAPKDMFGKIMSLSDESMWLYYKLLLDKGDTELEELKQSHPMQVKKELAKLLVGRYHSVNAANEALLNFEAVFSKKENPNEMPAFSYDQMPKNSEGNLLLIDLLSSTELFSSKKEIRRLIEQGAVKQDGQRMEDPFMPILAPTKTQEIVFQAGKRTFFKLF